MIDEILSAARADDIPAGWSNLWFIKKGEVIRPLVTHKIRHGKPFILPPGIYTHLFRLTDSTLYDDPPGECVMEDTPYELQTHLQFMLRF